MFMDQPTTPARLEVLIDLLRAMPEKSASVEAVKRFLQPTGLPGLTPASQQARQVITAGRELGLVSESNGRVALTLVSGERRSAREILLEHLDQRILGSAEIEPWFALFYAFLISGRAGKSAAGPGADARFWDEAFNREVFGNVEMPNRFNAEKYTGFRRWLRYMGLGWHDSENVFQPNPYGRLSRALPRIFGKDVVLESDAFMNRLAEYCPELDGGRVFAEVTGSNWSNTRECTEPLAAAMLELHEGEVVTLECPADSRGWSLRLAAPPTTAVFRSERFDRIRLGRLSKSGKRP